MSQHTCDLSSCFLCLHCGPEWRQLIAIHKNTRTFRRGERLFEEGAPVTGLYFITSGVAKMHKHWGGDKELTIRFAKAGDIVGLRGLGSNLTYPLSTTALETTKTCFVTTDFLEASLKVNPALSNELLHLYANELLRSERRMSNLAHMDVKGRIADAILAVLEAVGMSEDGYLNISISRQDLASYAGSTYETLFKAFTEWINAGIISTEGKRVRILDLNALEALVR